MARRTRIKADGQEFDVREAEFEIIREEWNEYRLLDGGKLRVKTMVARIFRVLDAEGKPAFTPDGEPHFIVRHRTDILGIE